MYNMKVQGAKGEGGAYQATGPWPGQVGPSPNKDTAWGDFYVYFFVQKTAQYFLNVC